MRIDGFTPFNTLPERVSRPASSVVPGDSVRAGQAATAIETQTTKVLAPRAVTASTANADYIPARREASAPSMPTPAGPGGQALASYQMTASLVLDEPDGVFGIDLYA